MSIDIENPGGSEAELRAALRDLAGGHEALAADRTIYVRKDGNDSNTGDANNAGGALLTIGRAIDVAVFNLDFREYNVKIKVNTGTYDEFVIIPPWIGGTNFEGSLGIEGNLADKTAVKIKPSGALPAGALGVVNIYESGTTNLSFLEIDASDVDDDYCDLVFATNAALLYYNNLSLGNTKGDGVFFEFDNRAWGFTSGGNSVFATSAGGYAGIFYGSFLLAEGVVEFLEDLEWSVAAFDVRLGGTLSDEQEFAYTGAVTGKRFNIGLASNVYSLSDLPGDVAGTLDASSTYNGARGIRQKAGAVIAGDLAPGTSQVIHDTSGGTFKLYANIGGVLKSVALT